MPEFRTAVLFVPTDWCEPYDAMAAAYTALKDEAGQKYAQAMAQFCQGDADGATKALTALAEEPQAVDAMVGLALIAEKSADRDKASEWFQKALDEDSENVTAASGLPGSRAPRTAQPAHRRQPGRTRQRRADMSTIHEEPLVPGFGEDADPDTLAAGLTPEEERARRRKKILLIVLSCLAALFMVIAGWYLLTRKPLTELPILAVDTVPEYKGVVNTDFEPMGVAVSGTAIAYT